MNLTGLSGASKQHRLEALTGALKRSKGVLHLGAHLAEEASQYAEAGKPVIWVEALPHIYAQLEEKLRVFPDQQAYCAVLGDEDGNPIKFHVSNNWEGVSSSIFEFGPYAAGENSLWPELNLKMIDTIDLTMTTIDALMQRAEIDMNQYDHWVIDLQGAELLALAGAEKTLPACTSLITEISQEAVYDNGVLWPALRDHLASRGFVPRWEPEKTHDDVLFERGS